MVPGRRWAAQLIRGGRGVRRGACSDVRENVPVGKDRGREPSSHVRENVLETAGAATYQPSATLLRVATWHPSSPLQPFNPSTLQPFNPSTLQPFNPSTLQPFN